MKKVTLKYFTAAFALIFINATVYCAVDGFAESLGEFGNSYHLHDDGAESHEHSAPVHSQSDHHGDRTTPEGDEQGDDFCCSKLFYSIPNQSIKPLAENLFFVAAASDAGQVIDFSSFATQEWLIHDISPPSHCTPFYVLNFPSHAPPSLSF